MKSFNWNHFCDSLEEAASNWLVKSERSVVVGRDGLPYVSCVLWLNEGSSTEQEILEPLNRVAEEVAGKDSVSFYCDLESKKLNREYHSDECCKVYVTLTSQEDYWM